MQKNMENKEPQPGQLLDLLDPQNRFDRVAECRQIYLEDIPGLPGILHRITLFLTFNCNLRCFYCNIIGRPDFDKRRPTKNSTYDLHRFVHFLDSLAGQDIRHLHLTGGEVTLVKDLPDMIRHASELKIPCSITTNGTAKLSFYEKLIDNGLKEIRISIDTMDAIEFDKNVGKKGALQKVLKTISGLVRLRDNEDKNIYLI